MDAAGATNLTWVCTLMGTTYRGTHGGADAWLPAPNSYHLVGSDGYNRWPVISRPAWRSFAELFTGAHQKSVELNKRLFVGEFGCIEQTEGYSAGDPMAKADWFQGAADTVRAADAPAGVEQPDQREHGISPRRAWNGESQR
jgi:hypothetical protein